MNLRRRLITEGPERTEGMLNTAAAVDRRSGACIEEAGAACTCEVGAAGLPSSWVAGSRVGKLVEGILMEGLERSPGAAEVG
jgi:hypothetical protein